MVKTLHGSRDGDRGGGPDPPPHLENSHLLNSHSKLPLFKNNKVINVVISYSKQYLLTCFKKKDKVTCLYGLLFYFFNKYNVKKYFACKNFEMSIPGNPGHLSLTLLFNHSRDICLI